jgi:hypothetical protein
MNIPKILEKITVGLILLQFALLAKGSPPFISDDPYPVDYKHWQAYFFFASDYSSHYRQTNFPSFSANYGLIPDLEVSLSAGLQSQTQQLIEDGQRPSVLRGYGFTDMQMTLKYAFIKEKPKFPQVAFAPTVNIPTGNARRGLGNGKIVITYPIWIQKTMGAWTTYGGGGYVQDFAPNSTNFYFEGWVLQKNINDKWMVGGEIFNQTGNLITGKPITIATLGGGYNFKSNFSLLFSLGHQIAGEKHLMIYLGLFYGN